MNEEAPQGTYPDICSINDDCLWYIVQYLKTADVVQFAETCSRLRNFAESCIYPQRFKKICVEMHMDQAKLCTPKNTYTSVVNLKNFTSEFSWFGKFMKDLKIENCNQEFVDGGQIWCNSVIVIKSCTELTALRLRNIEFRPADVCLFKRLINSLQSLRELDVLGCKAIATTEQWRATTESIPKVNKISISEKEKFSSFFIQYFKNLVSLTIEFDVMHNWPEEVVAQIFDKIGNNLKHLELSNANTPSYGNLISDKLPNLENLVLRKFILKSKLEHMIGLPNLTVLEVFVFCPCDISLFLQKLSDNGVIEDLMITSGSATCVCLDEVQIHGQSLIFKKLKRFHFGNTPQTFLEAMTIAQMPVIKTFVLDTAHDYDYEFEYLFTFIESKPTLKSFSWDFYNDSVSIEIVRQIIEQVKTSSTPKPFWNLQIGELELDSGVAEEIELLNKENRDLIIVTYTSEINAAYEDNEDEDEDEDEDEEEYEEEDEEEYEDEDVSLESE